MKNLKAINILIEDFKSNNRISWIKFGAERLRNKSRNLWIDYLGNKEIENLLDTFIVNKFKFKPLGENWVEQEKEQIEHQLEFALSSNLYHGFNAWSEEKSKKLVYLILDSLDKSTRYFSNIKSEEFFVYSMRNDPRGTLKEYGVLFYDHKNIGGIWISQHEDPYVLMLKPDWDI